MLAAAELLIHILKNAVTPIKPAILLYKNIDISFQLWKVLNITILLKNQRCKVHAMLVFDADERTPLHKPISYYQRIKLLYPWINASILYDALTDINRMIDLLWNNWHKLHCQVIYQPKEKSKVVTMKLPHMALPLIPNILSE